MKLEEVPEEIIDGIRKQYGYRTRAALMRQYGLSEYMFDSIIKKHGIERIDPSRVKVKAPKVDYSTMQHIPVPGLTGNVVVFSKKGKDPEAIRSKYKR
ncbi:MAG: hypothetical protein QHC79_09365 [Pseudosphingobacterium sp.]|nr:hypothetical protein [Pseudosphingobacterium sp.]